MTETITRRKQADAFELLARAIAGLAPETADGLLYGEIFRHIADNERSNGYGSMASVLTNIFIELPDDARTEAIAELICGLFNHMGADVFSGIVGNVVKRLPEGALSAEDVELVTAQLLAEA